MAMHGHRHLDEDSTHTNPGCPALQTPHLHAYVYQWAKLRLELPLECAERCLFHHVPYLAPAHAQLLRM